LVDEDEKHAGCEKCSDFDDLEFYADGYPVSCDGSSSFVSEVAKELIKKAAVAAITAAVTGGATHF
jgi:hypothetical protein